MSRTMTYAAWLGLTLAASTFNALPATAAVNAGTLTCTLAPSLVDPPEPASASVSCTFKPIIGVDARFEGVIERFGVTDPRDAKIVLVWSVVAPEAKLPIESLEGKYFGSIATPADTALPGAPESPETTLIGGMDKSVQLRPLTPDPNVAPGNGVTVLELKLARMRT